VLKHLSIKNVAVIESADIDFDSGLSVLTGETGAGKSIIIDAINMLKGERASRSLIRAGETKARVDGVFETDSSSAAAIADIMGTESETEIIISREMNSDGKNTIRVNGMPVNITMLKAIGEHLVNIHGQHDNTSLLSVRSHIGFLDRFGGEETAKLILQYRDIHSSLEKMQSELSELCTSEQENLRRRDMLLFQTKELEEAQLEIGEEEELEARLLLLDNAQSIAQNTSVAYEMLYGGEEVTCHDVLWSAIKKLEDVSDFSPEVADLCASLSEAGYLIDEKARELRSVCDGISFDGAEKKNVEDRLELIYNLKRKYGSTIEEILEFYDNACEELSKIENSDERAAELESEIQKLSLLRKNAASALSAQRQRCARKLEAQVKSHLADLNMAKVEFEVHMTEADYGSNGADSVEFLICTNVGEEKKPLAKIASGGELSRIMLAIKNVLAAFDGGKTVIFDEIDTGVSGNAAQKIGEKLYSMSLSAQVLCITHLPQISALADTHYLISKTVSSGRTLTCVEPLDTDGRAQEIARTLGGAEVTDIARQNARELINSAEDIKKYIRNKTEDK